jgi:glutamyl-tRNA synthetase
MSVRVRFAPSPTGYLHVGGARTALFNWLYARRHGGTFILRIEDTDVERSSADMVTGILDSLRWLGLNWDEGPGVAGPHAPYFQSERINMYRRAAEELVAAGRAYRCYCDPAELKARRESAQADGSTWTYDRTCLRLSPDDRADRERAGAPAAIRFLVPDGSTSFDDLVHGHLEFDHAHIEDFVLLRSDGHPTYQLSVVVDDAAMEVTHVVRGDDHISNTPKQILLYRAMNAPIPTFAHVPLILGPDKKRLSKRHGATSVGEYESQGYLPEAMVNFLALLGWSPGGDAELFTLDELVQRFAIEGIGGGNAVFNPEKLDWFNQQHIMRLSGEALLERLWPDLERAGLSEEAGRDRALASRAIDLVKPRAKKLADIVPQLRPFISDAFDRDAAAMAQHVTKPDMRAHLEAWIGLLATVDPFDAASIEAALRALAAERGIKAASLIHATRVAVTGQTVSPGIFDVIVVAGRERVIGRLADALGSRA